LGFRLWQRHQVICELTFPTSVLAVKLNRKRLIVVLEEQIYVYDIATMKHVYTIETGSNPGGSTPVVHSLTVGICSLSSSAENSYLVFPNPNSTLPSFHPSHTPSQPTPLQHTGEVLVFDTLSLTPVNIIPAHKTPIAILALSPKGDILATASDKGTVIRVFSIPSGDKLFQFRRGSYPAHITSMAFNQTGEFLVVGSDTETVHLFRCTTPKGAGGNSNPSGGAGNRPWASSWSGTSGPGSPSTESTMNDDMDRVIEQKRRNGSMGYLFSPLQYWFCRQKIRKGSQSLTKQFATSLAPLLPTSVTEIWEPSRDFARIKLPTKTTSSPPNSLLREY
jgi:autophagy-related protein 18